MNSMLRCFILGNRLSRVQRVPLILHRHLSGSPNVSPPAQALKELRTSSGNTLGIASGITAGVMSACWVMGAETAKGGHPHYWEVNDKGHENEKNRRDSSSSTNLRRVVVAPPFSIGTRIPGTMEVAVEWCGKEQEFNLGQFVVTYNVRFKKDEDIEYSVAAKHNYIDDPANPHAYHHEALSPSDVRSILARDGERKFERFCLEASKGPDGRSPGGVREQLDSAEMNSPATASDVDTILDMLKERIRAKHARSGVFDTKHARDLDFEWGFDRLFLTLNGTPVPAERILGALHCEESRSSTPSPSKGAADAYMNFLPIRPAREDEIAPWTLKKLLPNAVLFTLTVAWAGRRFGRSLAGRMMARVPLDTIASKPLRYGGGMGATAGILGALFASLIALPVLNMQHIVYGVRPGEEEFLTVEQVFQDNHTRKWPMLLPAVHADEEPRATQSGWFGAWLDHHREMLAVWILAVPFGAVMLSPVVVPLGAIAGWSWVRGPVRRVAERLASPLPSSPVQFHQRPRSHATSLVVRESIIPEGRSQSKRPTRPGWLRRRIVDFLVKLVR